MLSPFLCPSCHQPTLSRVTQKRDYGLRRQRGCRHCAMEFVTIDDGNGEQFSHWVAKRGDNEDIFDEPEDEESVGRHGHEADPLETWYSADEMRHALATSILNELKWFCVDSGGRVVKRIEYEARIELEKFADLIRQKREVGDRERKRKGQFVI